MKVLTTKIKGACISVNVMYNNKRYKIYQKWQDVRVSIYCDNGLGLIATEEDIDGLQQIDSAQYSDAKAEKVLRANVEIIKEYLKLLFEED